MLVRFVYLAVVRVFAVLRLLSMTDRERDVEILALRHRLTILQRQLGGQRPRLRPEDRIFLSMLPVPLPRAVLRRLRLVVSPDTVLRWHHQGRALDRVGDPQGRRCRLGAATDDSQVG
ncbi:hypothetical protein [Amycolatopsis sp. NPDC054798]